MDKSVIELFAGVGGFRVGLNHIESFDVEKGNADESNGKWKFVWTNQYEPSTKGQPAYECLKKRFGNDDAISNTDISKVDMDDIPEASLVVGGFPCFIAGTLVMTDKGLIPIENIKPGDRVLTHKNRFMKVTATGSHFAPTVIVSDCSGRTIECTPNHPFYARRYDGVQRHEPEWISANDLENTEWSSIVRVPNDNSLWCEGIYTENFFYSAGRWLCTGIKDFCSSDELLSAEFLFPENKKHERTIPFSIYMLAHKYKESLLAGYTDVNNKTLPTDTIKTAMGILAGTLIDPVEDGKNFTKVENVSPSGGKCKIVYNLSVEEDESYTANGLYVHNCQNYSVAATLKNSKGIEGKKGVLFWDIMRLVDAKNPPFLLLENVDRLLKSPAKQRGRDFGIMLRSFSDRGYDLEWRVINAADYGFPQRRRRVFIFAWKRCTAYGKKNSATKPEDMILHDGIFCQSFSIKSSETLKTTDIAADSVGSIIDLSNSYTWSFENAGCAINGKVSSLKVLPNSEPVMPLKDIMEKNVGNTYDINAEQDSKFAYFRSSKRFERISPAGEKYIYSEGAMEYPDSVDKPSRTMLTSEGGISRTTHVVADLNTGAHRLLSPIECERLQTFPDNWTDTGMTVRQRRFMMGNALVCGLIGRIEPFISKIIESEPE